jgi:hypothetical protein
MKGGCPNYEWNSPAPLCHCSPLGIYSSTFLITSEGTLDKLNLPTRKEWTKRGGEMWMNIKLLIIWLASIVIFVKTLQAQYQQTTTADHTTLIPLALVLYCTVLYIRVGSIFDEESILNENTPRQCSFLCKSTENRWKSFEVTAGLAGGLIKADFFF